MDSGGGDRLSELGDRVLGHILSFLPADEAARAALLSSRWRDVFAAVHTVSLEEPVPPLREGDYDMNDVYSYRCYKPPPVPKLVPCMVSNALLARGRRAAPLRALRVAIDQNQYEEERLPPAVDSTTVDRWVSYAVQEAAAPEGLHLDLRLGRVPLCNRPYSLQSQDAVDEDDHHHSMSNKAQTPAPRVSHRRHQRSISSNEGSSDSEPSPQRGRSISPSSDHHDHAGDQTLSSTTTRDEWSLRDDVTRSPPSPLSSSSDDTVFRPSPPAYHAGRYYYCSSEGSLTVPPVLFSCAALRSLSLGHCGLAPPAKVDLPSLETLLLSHVSDPRQSVEHIMAGSPRLADLTLEACDKVLRLNVPTSARLRRLALRCCHGLATVVLDASELVAFEYRGAVPSSTFLTLHGGSPKVTYCKVDICGEEASSKEDATRLGKLLKLFANTKRLHLESARLGAGFDDYFPALSNLVHLELRGRVPSDDTAVIGAVSRMLGHAPNIQALSLIFHPEEHDRRWTGLSFLRMYNEEELLDEHRLKYNGQSVVVAVPSTAASMPPCLRSSVTEINLVHYQGGKAQRALAKFLLCNAPAIDKLWCEFAQGDLWTQTQLMREIKGWVMNKSANTQFM